MNQKECVGIDVSKDFIDCVFGSINTDQNISLSKSKKFTNSLKGFEQLYDWTQQLKTLPKQTFVMEATGVYYENLAFWLAEKGSKVCVILPNKLKHFVKSYNIKTKTDAIDAKIICHIGLERKLEPWVVPAKLMRNIKQLSREYRENKAKLVIIKNQLHAKLHSYQSTGNTTGRLQRQIDLIAAQLHEIEAELRVLSMSDSKLYDRLKLMLTIPGVQFMTAITILAETNCFALVNNAKQLTSYAGMDIQHNQSGLKEGKSRMSKKGNSHIRNALYMPALCCCKHNPQLREFYKRLAERKPAKKIAVTAVARKLLTLMYTLWKKEVAFDPEHGKKQPEKTASAQQISANEKTETVSIKKSRQVNDLPTQDEFPLPETLLHSLQT
jgi:transposase